MKALKIFEFVSGLLAGAASALLYHFLRQFNDAIATVAAFAVFFIGLYFIQPPNDENPER